MSDLKFSFLIVVLTLSLIYFISWAESDCPKGKDIINSVYMPTRKCEEK